MWGKKAFVQARLSEQKKDPISTQRVQKTSYNVADSNILKTLQVQERYLLTLGKFFLNGKCGHTKYISAMNQG